MSVKTVIWIVEKNFLILHPNSQLRHSIHYISKMLNPHSGEYRFICVIILLLVGCLIPTTAGADLYSISNFTSITDITQDESECIGRCDCCSHCDEDLSFSHSSHSPFYMALKTNMLYDVLAVPAIGAEFYVGRNLTVGANWMYAWWSCERRHRYWRIYGGDINLRYRFGSAAHPNPLTGHHIGIYAGAFTFDLEFGGTAYMGGKPGHSLWDRCILNIGVEYGYSLPISRRLNIDFTLGVGYMGGLIEKFNPEDGYYLWESTSRRRWFGPTKAEISLVWLIGSGNINSKKGGYK